MHTPPPPPNRAHDAQEGSLQQGQTWRKLGPEESWQVGVVVMVRAFSLSERKPTLSLFRPEEGSNLPPGTQQRPHL